MVRLNATDLVESRSHPAARWFAALLNSSNGWSFGLRRLWLIWGTGVASLAVSHAVETSAPNFVFIMGEGQGWTSTSIAMDDRIPWSRGAVVRTPNLERLASAGMRFSAAYAASPRCTPSRAAFLTGKSPARLHMTFVNDRASDGGALTTPEALTQLPVSEVTIAALLRRRGYATAQFGKWHVGRLDPRQYGFDESDGPNGNGGPENVETPNPKQASLLTQLGIGFMSRQVKAGRPFYLQLCHYAPRGAAGVRPETLASVRERMSAQTGAGNANRGMIDIAAMEDMDATIGSVWAALADLGIVGKTYVIYMPDHGTPGGNGWLAGGKGGVWEGGVRVPLLIAGPGITPATVSPIRVTGLDLFPTIAELAGITKLPADIEGASLVPILKVPGIAPVTRATPEFVIHFPHYDKDPGGPASAVYQGNFKLIKFYESGTSRLYDLARDPGERSDIAGREPVEVGRLERSLVEYLKRVEAQMPVATQGGDVRRQPTQKRNGGRGSKLSSETPSGGEGDR